VARLVSFNVRKGQRLRMAGQIFTIVHSATDGTGVLLQSEGAAQTVRLSTSELAFRIVREDATFIDELEDPDIRQENRVTNISFLTTHRIFDRYLMMILVNGLLATRESPKSSDFRRSFDAAASIMECYREHCIISGGKKWSMWTIYHLLLRWRTSGYAINAFHLKGIMLHPWRKRDPRYIEAQEMVSNLVEANPGRSIAWIHKEINRTMRGRAAGAEPSSAVTTGPDSQQSAGRPGDSINQGHRP
jgi:hypothetical protein